MISYHGGMTLRLHTMHGRLRARSRAIILVLSMFALAACQETTRVGPLRVAEQYGLAYAPLALLQYAPELLSAAPDIEWVQVGNAAAIREAMVAGQLDVGFMGIPPYLIGVDRGMEWHAEIALSRMPLGLMSRSDEITSLESLLDAGPAARIAVPQPGSIQHILLTMALARHGADPRALDDRLVSLAHPDATSALLAGREVAAYFAPPPFLFVLREEPDSRELLSAVEAYGGEFTFIIGAVRTGRSAPSERMVSSFLAAVTEAQDLLATIQQKLPENGALSPGDDQFTEREAAALAAVSRAYEIDPESLAGQLADPLVHFGPEILGLERFREVMTELGYLERAVGRDRQ